VVGIRSASTYASAATEASTSGLVLPSGWQPGDVIYIGCELTAATGSITTPGGWTAVVPQFVSAVGGTPTSGHAAGYRRVMQAGDTDPVFSFTSGRFAAAMVAVQGADNTTPEDATPTTDDNTGVTAPSVRAPSITPVTDNCLLLTFHAIRNLTSGVLTSFTADASETEQADAGTGVAAVSEAAVEAASLALGTAGATGTKTATATGSNVTSLNMMGFTVAVRPAPALAASGIPQQQVPGWVPGAPAMPGGQAFAPWPPQVSPPGPVAYTAALGSQAAGSSTFALTLSHDVAQHDALVAYVSSNSGATAPLGVSDSAGNVYQPVYLDTNRAPNLGVWVALNVQPMVSGTGQITVTYAGTATVKNVVVRGCPGMSGVLAVDQIAAADLGSGTAPGAGPTQQLFTSGEWVLAGIADGTSGGAPTGWTGGVTQGPTQGPGPFLTVADRIAPDTLPVTVGATLGAAGTWTCVLVTLSPLVVPQPPPPDYRAALPLAGMGLPGMPGGPAFTPWPTPTPSAPVQVGTQQGMATLASDTSIIAPVSIVLAPATLLADTSISDTAAELAPATLTALTTVSDSAVQDAPATLAAGGSVAAPGAVQQAPATLAMAGVVTDVAVQQAVATLAAAASVSTVARQLATATLTATMTVTDAAVQQAIATLAAATAVTAAASAPGAASLVGTTSMGLVVATQGAGAVLAAAAALPAPVAREAATALLAALATLAAPGAQRAPATLAAVWALTADALVISAVDLLEGIAAGAPHSPWSASPPHAAGYAAGGPHSPWSATPPHR